MKSKDADLIAEAYDSMRRFVHVLLREYNDGRVIVYGIYPSAKEAQKAQQYFNERNRFAPMASNYTVRKTLLSPAIPDDDYLFRWSS